MTSGIRFEISAGEARLTLCRPETGNALRLDDIVAASQWIVDLARTAPDVKVLRVCAEGVTFCAGRVVETGAPRGQGPESTRRGLVDPILDLYRALHSADIVSVAQVQGDAHGLGCALIAACDLAVVASTAKFSLPEMQKDLPPTLALSAVLPSMHLKAAASLVLGGATIDGRGAVAAGLAGEVVDAENLGARVDAIVRHLVGRHPVAIKTVKRYLRAAGAPDHQTNAELAASLLSGAMSDIRADQTKNG